MPLRHNYPFQPVRGTTAPSFTAGSTLNLGFSTAHALESTALLRIWAGPSGRAIRVAEDKGIDFHLNFGSSLVEAASSDSLLILGGTVETFHIPPTHTYIALASVSTTTGAVANVTLGYGE